MARGYMARVIAAAASRESARTPEPTKADFAAEVYEQTWLAPTGTRTRFAVLALSSEHAKRLGLLRITEQGGTLEAASVTLAENVCWGFDADRALNILQYETAAEREDRQTEVGRHV